MRSLKNYPEGLKYAKLAYDWAKKHDFKTEMAYALMSKATLLRHSTVCHKALATIRQAIEIGEQNRLLQHLPESYNIRSKIYLAMGGEKKYWRLEDAQSASL